MINKYASKVEEKAAKFLEPLGFILCNKIKFPHRFVDANNEEFSAMPDFYHPDDRIYVEVKDGELNDIDSKEGARLADKNSTVIFKKSHRFWNYIRNSWSNSVNKIAITQQRLGAGNLIVVFVQDLSQSKGKAQQRTLKLIEEKGVIACDLNYFNKMYFAAKADKVLRRNLQPAS